MAWYNSTDGDAIVNSDTGNIVRREPRDGGRKALVAYTAGGAVEVAFGLAAAIDTKFATLKTSTGSTNL